MVSYEKRGNVISQVVEWNRNWLMLGGFVACAECLEFQSVEYFGEPFKHASTCSKNGQSAENPWVSLEAILNWSVGQGRGAINPDP
jgi:hypothetical protein